MIQVQQASQRFYLEIEKVDLTQLESTAVTLDQKSEEFHDVVQTDQWEIGTFTWNQALMVAVFAGGAALKCYIDRMVEKNF